MGKPFSRRRAAGLLTVALLAAAAGLVAHHTSVLARLERSTVDARFSLRHRESPPSGVVLVGIDNDSLGALPRYPFSRRFHARVIENLHAAGARLIVYDISFDRPTTPSADRALFDAAARGAPIVFATSLISPSGATEVLGGDANLRSIGDQAAAADLLPDDDGVARHLLEQVSGLPTVAAAVANRLGIRRGSRQLRGGWIDFPGPPGTVRAIPFVRVLHGQFDRAAIRGKVVVVGATASVLQDLHSTAAGSPMSGPEVQADAISTVLEGFRLRNASAAVVTLLIVTLALLVALFGVWLGSLGVALAAVAMLVLWSLASQLAFDSGVVLDYTSALLSLLLATGGAMILGLWSDSRERARLRELFAAGAAPVVEQVLDPAASGQLEPTAIIAGYKIEEVVGRGGMGVVYRASQLALARAVAIKLIAPERSQHELFRERFKTESRVAASIEHANVIPVYEAGEDDGLLFIAMRLVDGVDLAQLLEREGPLAPARVARLMGQLCGALDAAHARGLVHRDVKPANVLVTFDQPEHLYLTDFGVAMHVGGGAGLTRPDQFVGTLDYLAPEQIHGEGMGAHADIYAIAGVLHHCLTGQIPFPRENEAAKLWAHINAEPPLPSRLVPGLPVALDGVIARGMAKDPNMRFATAIELAVACAKAVGVSLAVGRAGETSDSREPMQPSASTIVSDRPEPSGELVL
jgi:serine/threonine protein kinase/CHASE2 domain-containing sensor protein